MLGRLILLRILTSIGTLLLVSIIIFGAVELLPGDVARNILGRETTQQAIDTLRKQLHLDRPVVERYTIWISGVLRGDLGSGLLNKRPIADIIAPRLRNTLVLAAAAFALYIPFSLIFGILSAAFRDRPVDTFLSTLTLIGLSVPEFVMGTILLIVFAVMVRWFPALSLIEDARNLGDALRALALPATTLAIAMS